MVGVMSNDTRTPQGVVHGHPFTILHLFGAINRCPLEGPGSSADSSAVSMFLLKWSSGEELKWSKTFQDTTVTSAYLSRLRTSTWFVWQPEALSPASPDAQELR